MLSMTQDAVVDVRRLCGTICRLLVVFSIGCAFQLCRLVTACWPYRAELLQYPTVHRIHGQFML